MKRIIVIFMFVSALTLGASQPVVQFSVVKFATEKHTHKVHLTQAGMLNYFVNDELIHTWSKPFHILHEEHLAINALGTHCAILADHILYVFKLSASSMNLLKVNLIKNTQLTAYKVSWNNDDVKLELLSDHELKQKNLQGVHLVVEDENGDELPCKLDYVCYYNKKPIEELFFAPQTEQATFSFKSSTGKLYINNSYKGLPPSNGKIKFEPTRLMEQIYMMPMMTMVPKVDSIELFSGANKLVYTYDQAQLYGAELGYWHTKFFGMYLKGALGYAQSIETFKNDGLSYTIPRNDGVPSITAINAYIAIGKYKLFKKLDLSLEAHYRHLTVARNYTNNTYTATQTGLDFGAKLQFLLNDILALSASYTTQQWINIGLSMRLWEE